MITTDLLGAHVQLNSDESICDTPTQIPLTEDGWFLAIVRAVSSGPNGEAVLILELQDRTLVEIGGLPSLYDPRTIRLVRDESGAIVRG